MKRKFVTHEMLMVFYSQQKKNKKSIHTQLEETVAERKRIMQQYMGLFKNEPATGEKLINIRPVKNVA